MKKLLFLFIMCCSFACGQVLNFSQTGNIESNRILKELIAQELDTQDFDVVSYYHDFDSDGQNEILGIVKTNLFYSLAGYKLIALKLDESGYWKIIESDVYFDETKDFIIHNKHIKYSSTVLYKHKKFSAKIKKNKIAAKKSIFDKLKDKKANHIEQIASFTQGREQLRINLEHFPEHNQKDAELFYRNLSEKTKRYMQ